MAKNKNRSGNRESKHKASNKGKRKEEKKALESKDNLGPASSDTSIRGEDNLLISDNSRQKE